MKTGNSATAWAAVQSCQEKSKRANAPGDDGGTVLRYQRLHLGIVGDDGLSTALAGLGLGLVAAAHSRPKNRPGCCPWPQ